MTAVQSLPNLQSLPTLGWTSGGSSQNSYGADDANRSGIGRKGLQRSNSSSSDSSKVKTSIGPSSPTKNDTTATAQSIETSTGPRFVRGFWAAPKSDLQTSALTNALNGRIASDATSITMNQPPLTPQTGALIPSPKTMQNGGQAMTNGTRMGGQPQAQETPALLILLPMNATFERKQINVPLFPEMLRIGRQTNAKTIPTPTNGYFDSKVLSRQHAEVWADRSGKVWIRDVKSSNGTFVNGIRLSPESRDSEPHELRENDMLELGIDIVSEDQKSIVHHKVSAKIEHAGVPTNATSVLDLNMADIEPGSGGGLSMPTGNGVLPRRLSNSSTASSNSRAGYAVNNTQAAGYGVQRHMGAWVNPVSIEQVVKRLRSEMRQAKQQSQDLHRTGEFIHALLNVQPGQEVPKAPADLFQAPPIVNGVMPHKEHISPFSQPPAPPPQLPLPEKPDVSPSDGHSMNSLKRHEAEKFMSGGSKIEPATSQILQLVEALSSAKKEIDYQGDRMRELEEELRRERIAREHAEERMRLFLETLHDSKGSPKDTDDASSVVSEDTIIPDSTDRTTVDSVTTSTTRLQERLDTMLYEMKSLKDQMESYKRRAEVAEGEKSSLADMVEQIRLGNKLDSSRSRSSQRRRNQDQEDDGKHLSAMNGSATKFVSSEDKYDKSANGSADKSILYRKQLQDLATTAMSLQRDDRFMHSAPYASIIGVVLIGVGVMTYLNGWQKLEAS